LRDRRGTVKRPHSTGRHHWVWLTKLAVSAALLGYILWRVPLQSIGESLAGIQPVWLSLSLLATVPILWLMAWQMRILLSAVGPELSTPEIVRVNLVTEFYAFFLPSYVAGGALRWYLLGREGSPAMATLAMLVYNRLVNITVIAVSALLLWFADPPTREDGLIPWLLTGLLAILVLLHVVIFNRSLADRIRGLALRWARSGLLRQVSEKLSELAESAHLLGSLGWRTRVGVYGLCLVRQCIAIAAFYGFAVSLSLGISWVNVGFARAVAILATLLPISFAGVGIREGGLILALAGFDVPSGPAVALSLVMLLRDFLIRLSGGLLAAWRWVRGYQQPGKAPAPTPLQRNNTSVPVDGEKRR